MSVYSQYGEAVRSIAKGFVLCRLMGLVEYALLQKLTKLLKVHNYCIDKTSEPTIQLHRCSNVAVQNLNNIAFQPDVFVALLLSASCGP